MTMTTPARTGPGPTRHDSAPRAVRVREVASRFVQGLATPLLPQDYLDLVAPLRSGADLRARIVAITPETADAATITLKPGRSWRGHLPGQYIRVGIDIDGVRRWRAYSLTSDSTERDGCISITVKAMPDGWVSRYLVHRARPGTLVMLDQASGHFVMPDPMPERILFVTGGSGITPVMAMLRGHAFDGRDVVVLHSAPRPEDVIFADELADPPAGVRVLLRHTDTDGMLAPSMLETIVPDWRERQTWACGPTPMLDDLEGHFFHEGLEGALHVERFRPTITATGDGGEVTLREGGGEERTFEVDGSSTILDAAEDAGAIMPSGCRMGICFGCVLPMTDGAVRDLRNGTLTETTHDDPPVMIQTCVSAAAGACTIEKKEQR